MTRPMSDHDHDHDEEAAEFREAVGPVRPVITRRVEPESGRVPARPLQREADEARVMEDLATGGPDFSDLETGEELVWLRPGVQKRVLRRLRRGHWRVQAELDLHQMNTDAAGRSIRSFLAEAGERGLTCVKIIHGKGLRSGPGGPRLKRLTGRLLSRHKRVLAFAGAPAGDGGTGAVYVLMRNRR